MSERGNYLFAPFASPLSLAFTALFLVFIVSSSSFSPTSPSSSPPHKKTRETERSRLLARSATLQTDRLHSHVVAGPTFKHQNRAN